MCDCLMLQRDCLLPGCFWQQHKKRSWVKAKRAGNGLQRWCLSTCPVAVADHLADHDSHAHLPENQALCYNTRFTTCNWHDAYAVELALASQHTL